MEFNFSYRKKDDKGFNYLEMDDYVKRNIIQALQDIGEEKLVSLFEDNIDDNISDELNNYKDGEEFFIDDIVDNVKEAIILDLDIETANDVVIKIIGRHNIYNFDMDEIDNLQDGASIHL